MPGAQHRGAPLVHGVGLMAQSGDYLRDLLGVAVANVFVTWAAGAAKDLAVAGTCQGADVAICETELGGDDFCSAPKVAPGIEPGGETVEIDVACLWGGVEVEIELRVHFFSSLDLRV